MLILAPLTSVPNAITAVRLGLAGRGAALVGETLNSNSINLGVGALAPALFTSLGVLTMTAKLELAWVLGMTVVCIALLARPRGMRRREASVVIILYLGFVAIEALGEIRATRLPRSMPDCRKSMRLTTANQLPKLRE